MKIQALKEEIKKLELKELVIKLDAVRRDQFSLRLNSATSHVKDYSQFRKGRKNIARILTELRQRGVK